MTSQLLLWELCIPQSSKDLRSGWKTTVLAVTAFFACKKNSNQSPRHWWDARARLALLKDACFRGSEPITRLLSSYRIVSRAHICSCVQQTTRVVLSSGPSFTYLGEGGLREAKISGRISGFKFALGDNQGGLVLLKIPIRAATLVEGFYWKTVSLLHISIVCDNLICAVYLRTAWNTSCYVQVVILKMFW